MRYQDPRHQRFRVTQKVPIVIAATVASACANADSGLYAGAGLTEVRASNAYSLNFDCRDCPVWSLDATSWEALLGWRPIRPFAVEAKYESLGETAYRLSHGTVSLDASSAGVYALGFLPLPLPVLDLYAKVGLVRSELSGHSYTFAPRSDARMELALGTGVQAHLRRVGVRLEYEHFNIPQTTHAYVYSVAATYDLY